MSSLVSGISGGQPSTTQPIAIPWLSPKVVTRNMWPKVLKDMVCLENRRITPCGNARARGGQTLGRHSGMVRSTRPGIREFQGSVLRTAPE